MSEVVVLKLPSWAEKCEFNDIEIKDYVEETISIKPLFNRYGIYILRKKKMVILECKYGCFDFSKYYNEYKRDLEMLNHTPLSDREYNALSIVVFSKYIDTIYKQQIIKVYQNESHRRTSRNMRLDMDRRYLQFKKESKGIEYNE